MAMTTDGRLLLTTINNEVRIIEMSNPNGPLNCIQTDYVDQMGSLQNLLTLAVSSDGATAIVGKAASRGVPLPDYLVVLDVAGRSVKGKVPINGSVSQVAMAPDGRLALATVYNNDGEFTVIFIDVPNQTVTDVISLNHSVIPPLGRISIGDSYAFILVGPNAPETNGTIQVLDLSRKTIITTLDAGPVPTAMVVRQDNSSIVVSNAQGMLVI
jgi:hypothetical protein